MGGESILSVDDNSQAPRPSVAGFSARTSGVAEEHIPE
jgi:hypothetical protein